MATYIILNCGVLAGIVLVLYCLRSLIINRVTMVVLLVLCVTTAIFDSLLIFLRMFAYNPERIIGLSIGLAPIEDFCYALVVGLLVPSLWHLTGRYSAKTRATI